MSGLIDLGWDAAWQGERDHLDMDGDPYRIVRHDGVKVLVSDGESTIHALFPRSLQLAVGDWVLVKNETVAALLPRRTVLQRDHEIRGPQLIASNIDLVLVVFGVDRPLRHSKVMRFVAFAWDIGAEPIVILSKVDLVDDASESVDQVAAWVPNVQVHTTSIETGEGIAEIFSMLEGCTGTLIGESGAGKSSIVNALMQDEVAWVGEVRAADAKGRHITSHRELHLLPGGGMIIDNPGVRALGLAADGEGVDSLFSDIDDLVSECRFRDCSHQSEPGCAVAAAVASGEISRERVAAYIKFTNEQGETRKRSDAKELTAHFRKEATEAREAREVRDRDDINPDG